jgi:hypothetical protein
MPKKIHMFLSNGNHSPVNLNKLHIAQSPAMSVPNPYMSAPKSSAALNAPFLARIHNVRPGCGSCGRH